MASLFSQSIMFLEIMQVVESIQYIKAVRASSKPLHLHPINPEDVEIPEFVPFILHRAYQAQVVKEGTFSDTLSGKDF
jgi:hypothetical protein